METYAEAHPERDMSFGNMNPDDELKEDERDTGEKGDQKDEDVNAETGDIADDDMTEGAEGEKENEGQKVDDGLSQGMATENVEIQGVSPTRKRWKRDDEARDCLSH